MMKPKLRKIDLLVMIIVVILVVPVAITFFGFRIYPVVSNSMLHWNSNDSWLYEETYYAMWETENYSREEIMAFPFSGGFEMGDCIIAVNVDNFSIGDVVVWSPPGTGKVLTHRLIYDNGSVLGLLADNTGIRSENITEHFADIGTKIEFNLKRVRRDEVQEKAVSIIPKLCVPYLFVACIQNKYCGLPCFFNSTCLQDSFGGINSLG